MGGITIHLDLVALKHILLKHILLAAANMSQTRSNLRNADGVEASRNKMPD
jgi:hypothetical protein